MLQAPQMLTVTLPLEAPQMLDVTLPLEAQLKQLQQSHYNKRPWCSSLLL